MLSDPYTLATDPQLPVVRTAPSLIPFNPDVGASAFPPDTPQPSIPDSSPPEGKCLKLSDCLEPENQCLVRHCSEENRCDPKRQNLGTECNQNGGLRCDLAGACVTCLVDDEKNFEETDIDCGGPYCEPCQTAQACARNSDCDSLVCLSAAGTGGAVLAVDASAVDASAVDASAVDAGPTPGICAAASCIDGKKNGTEGGPDCGGECPNRCDLGIECEQGSDCSSNFCVDGVCCGTACEGRCRSCLPASGLCRLAALGTDPRNQCGAGSCGNDGECGGCTNGTVDDGETDEDCGGPCAPCQTGQGCKTSVDCASGFCEDRKCVAPRCNNNKIDGSETDTDCGGQCGPFCSLGQRCLVKADCRSGSCVNESCVAP